MSRFLILRWCLLITIYFRFTTSIENIGNADFRPHIPKSHWVWHGCHQHYHSMEVCLICTICKLNYPAFLSGDFNFSFFLVMRYSPIGISFCLHEHKVVSGHYILQKFFCITTVKWYQTYWNWNKWFNTLWSDTFVLLN